VPQPKRVVYRAIARRDIEAVIDHYLAENADAAALGFVDELERATSELARHPKLGSTRYAYELQLPEVRSWMVKRFPFVVFYVEEPDVIDIWRVLHAENDVPSWLKKRL
jgi:toxin ParE1/3/4